MTDWFAGATPEEFVTLVRTVEQEVRCDFDHPHREQVVVAAVVVRVIERRDVIQQWSNRPIINGGAHAVDREGRDFYRDWHSFGEFAGPWLGPDDLLWRHLEPHHRDPEGIVRDAHLASA